MMFPSPRTLRESNIDSLAVSKAYYPDEYLNRIMKWRTSKLKRRRNLAAIAVEVMIYRRELDLQFREPSRALEIIFR